MIASVFKHAWGLYRKHFGVIAAVTIVIWLPLNLWISYQNHFVFDPDDFKGPFKFQMALYNFVGVVATAGVMSIGQTSHLGKRPSFGDAMSSGVSSWGRMCWTRWLTYITTGLSVGLVVILGLFLLQFLTLNIYAFAFGGILIVIFVSYWLVRLAVVEQVAFCEHVSGVTAMRRSCELTRGRFWQVFLLWLVVLALDITAIAFYLPSIFTPALDNWIVDAMVGSIADVVLAFGELCLFSAYLCLSQSRDIDEPEFPANTPAGSVTNSANPYEPPSAT